MPTKQVTLEKLKTKIEKTSKKIVSIGILDDKKKKLSKRKLHKRVKRAQRRIRQLTGKKLEAIKKRTGGDDKK